VKSHNLAALAVGATAALGVVALLSMLRADTLRRRSRDGTEALSGSQRQIERWDDEGGQVAQDAADEGQESGLRHA
jgi:hypothetical protein